MKWKFIALFGLTILFSATLSGQTLTDVWEKGLKKCATTDLNANGIGFRKQLVFDPTPDQLLGQMFDLQKGGGLGRYYGIANYKDLIGEPTIIGKNKTPVACEYSRNIKTSVGLKIGADVLKMPLAIDAKIGSIQETNLTASWHWETLDERNFLDSLEKIPQGNIVRRAFNNKKVFMVTKALMLDSLTIKIIYKPDHIVSGKVSIPDIISSITSTKTEVEVKKTGDNSISITTTPKNYFVFELRNINEKVDEKQKTSIFNFGNPLNKGQVKTGWSLP